MADRRFQSRAAPRAALLFGVVALTLALATPLDAKMRIDRLWLVTAAGHEVPIDIEVAEEQSEKALGLMFRTELPDDKGMLFPYDGSREVTMWMRNTYIPLDM